MAPSSRAPIGSPAGVPGPDARAPGPPSSAVSPDVPIPSGWRATKRTASALTLSAALAACAWVFSVLVRSRNAYGFEWVNHDVAFNLYTGRLLLGGQRLYVDRLEINPPGIFFLAGLVDRMATWVRVSPVLFFHAFVLALGIFGLLAMQNVLAGRYARARCAPMPGADGRVSVAVLTLVPLAFLLVIIGCGLPGEASFTYAFGQREHLFALVFIPYLFWRMSRGAVAPTITILLTLVGLFAGMKPQLFILIAAVEAIGGRQSKRYRWSVWLPLLGGAALPYALLLFHSPRSFAALFTQVVPRYFDGTYAYFNQPYSGYWASAVHGWILGYAGATGYLMWPAAKKRLISTRTSLCVCVLPALAYALVVWQHKFWGYHSIVVVSLLLVLGSYVGSTLLALLSDWRRHALLTTVLVAAVAALVSATQSLRKTVAEWKHAAGPDGELLEVVSHLRHRPRTLYYSTSDVHTRLPLFLRQHEVGHWGHDFLFPAMVRDPNPEHRKQALDRDCAEQTQLIRSERPEAIVFHATGQALASRDEDVDRVLLQDCHIVPAEMYSQVSLPGVERVTLFVRR